MTDAVLLLHGIAQTARSMRAHERTLARSGYAVLNLDYRSRHMPLAELVESIHPAVSRFAARAPGAIHAVGHSMGGLLLRAYLARHRPARLGRVVMLGTPNRGSELADLLRGWRLYHAAFGPAGQELVTRQPPALLAALGAVDYPLGIVAGDRPWNRLAAALLPGPSDGTVTVASTRVAGMAAHVTVPASHVGLLSHPAALAATLAFLRRGTF